MYHSLLARCKLKECAKLFDADYASCKDLSCLKLGSDDLDHTFRLIHTLLVCSADGNCTVICDVDLHTCTLDDRVDSLSSLSDYITDLLRVNLHGNDLEVHISEEVLKALDICKNDVIIVCFTCNKSAGNTCNWFSDRYTGSHQ